MTPGLLIVHIEMSTICIPSIDMPSSFAFTGIVTFGLPILSIEAPIFSLFRYCDA